MVVAHIQNNILHILLPNFFKWDAKTVNINAGVLKICYAMSFGLLVI